MNKFTRLIVFCSVITVVFMNSGCTATAELIYDPLAVNSDFNPQTLDLVVKDSQRNRDIPVLIYLPKHKEAAPVVIFSHGLGGSRQGCAYLGRHWASRGYTAVFLQHYGSDEAVWKDTPSADRMAAMKKAAGLKNFMLRVKDVPAVIDALEIWNNSQEGPLYGRLDMKRIGMSGHSFGAVTTQAVSGQSFSIAGETFTDPRIKAALALSPSTPKRGEPQKVFGSVKIPWMLMTGTKDVSPIGDADAQSRLAVFPALPAGGKYELVLDGAEHSAFSDRNLPGDKEQRNPNHHKAILALSTAFWDAYLRGDDKAKAWLDGDGAAKVLEKNDRWQKK